MDRKFRLARWITRSRVWAILLIALLIASNSLPALGSSTTAMPAPAPQAVEPESAPQAAVPDAVAGRAVVGRTAYTETVALPDGTYEATISPRVLHWRGADGRFRPFDDTLRPAETPGYSYEVRARHTASFERAQDVAAGRPTVRVAVDGGSLTMVAVGANPSASSVSGARVTYADAWTGTNLTLTSDGDRIKEDIVLQRAPETAVEAAYAFVLQAEGLTARKRADNSVLFSDASGKGVFLLPAPFMTDAGGAYSADVGVALTELAAGGYRLELTPDLAWLRDAARAYPVTVDPTVEILTYQPDEAAAHDALVDEPHPSVNYGQHTVVRVGRYADGTRWDALLRFPELTTLPQDSMVIRAEMRLYAGTGTTGMPVTVHYNEADWDESTVRWNTAPPYGAAVRTATATVPGWTALDVRYRIRQVVRGEVPNLGFRVRSAGAAGEQANYHSSNSATPEYRPQLVVKYVPATRLGQGGLWQYVEHDHGGGNTSAVNVSTGNLVLTHDNGTFGSHVYNSQDPYGQTDLYDRAGAFYGEGWTFASAMRLYEVDSGRGVIFKDPSGGTDRVYAHKADYSSGLRTYERPLYYHMTLTKDRSSTADPGRVFKLVTDGGGDTLYFDGEGKVTEVTSPNGTSTAYAYDTQGRLVTITDHAARKTLLEYNGPGSPGRLSKVTDMAGRVSAYGYDAAGNLTSISHGVGTAEAVTTTFNYTGANLLTHVTDPNGNTSGISYQSLYTWDTGGDTQGWGAMDRTAVSQSTAAKYYGSGSLKLGLSSITDTAVGGASKVYAAPASYNAVQQELRAHMLAPAGSSLNARIVLTDSRGRVTYGPLTPLVAGRWTAVRLPDAHVNPAYKVKSIAFEVSAQAGGSFTGDVYLDSVLLKGVAMDLQDRSSPRQRVVRLAYDWEPKLQKCGGTVDREGACTTVSGLNHAGGYTSTGYIYDRYGMATSTVDPLGKTTDAAYDEELRLIRTTEPDGDTSSMTYHPGTNDVHTSTAPTGETTRQGTGDVTGGHFHYSIDPRNEERRKNGQDYVATVTRHDAADNLLAEEVNRYAAGADLEQGQLPAPIETLRRTSYTYDSNGNMTSMTDPNGNVTTYAYNAADELVRIEAPAGTGESTPRVTTIGRTADGSIQSVTDPKGQVTTYEYDALGQIVRVNYGVVNGTAAFSTAYTFDKNGNRLTMADKEGRSEYGYDANDRLMGEARILPDQTRKAASYSYFPNGSLKSYNTLGGQDVSFGYDAAGRLEWQTDPNDLDPATGAPRKVTYSYDEESRPAIIAYANGVSRRMFYGAAGDLRLIKLQKSDGTVLQSFEYDTGYTATGGMATNYWDGYVRAVTEKTLGLADSTVTYGYDDLGRLVSAVRTGTDPYDHRYSYDANDNRVAVTDGGVTANATYDAANQLTSQGAAVYGYDRNGNLASYGGNTLTYDAANRWTGGTVNGHSVAFGYDGEGRRVTRMIGAARTDFWYDHTGLALETGAANAAYLRGPGGTLLSRAGGEHYQYGADRLGSVTAVVNQEGNLAGSYRYDPWGKELSAGWGGDNPFRHTGTYRDEATGLYQMGARYYQPDTARFTQMDPYPSSPFEGQRYSYTPGNPANYVDPTGMRHARCWAKAYGPDSYTAGYYPYSSYTRIYGSGVILCDGIVDRLIARACLYREDGFWPWQSYQVCGPQRKRSNVWKHAASYDVACSKPGWGTYYTVLYYGGYQHGRYNGGAANSSWYKIKCQL